MAWPSNDAAAVAPTAAPAVSPERSPFGYSALGQHPFLYPVPLFIQNTFIAAQPGRPASLEGFLEERQTISCPASRTASGSGCEGLSSPAVAVGPRKVPYCPGEQLLKSAAFGSSAPLALLPLGAAAGTPAVASASTPIEDVTSECSTADTAVAKAMPEPPSSGTAGLRLLGRVIASRGGTKAASAAPAVLRGTATDPATATGVAAPQRVATSDDGAESTTELPSMGSAGHAQGRCKPCAFFHTKGCSSQGGCKFWTMRQLQKVAADVVPVGATSEAGEAADAAEA